MQGFAFLIPASSACARSLLVPGTCDLLTTIGPRHREGPSPLRGKLPTENSLGLQPTRPIQRLPVPGTVRPFPHPEPPLLFVLFAVAPLRGNGNANVTHAPSSPGIVSLH